MHIGEWTYENSRLVLYITSNLGLELELSEGFVKI